MGKDFYMANNKTSNKKYYWALLIVIGLSGIVYWLTACRSVGYNDSGELAANCFFYSIPHPTGYPLYVNLGRLAAVLLPGSIIFRCTTLSLLATALASGVLFLVMLFIPIKIQSTYIRISLAGAATLFTAFSPIWWAQATSNEVYSLTLMLNTLVVFCFMRYSHTNETKYFLAGFYGWGLSFTVHMSSLFLGFAIIYLCLITDGWRGLIKPKYIYGICFFIIPLTFYAYLPIRASLMPFLNWGAPNSWQGFINHISGWQYSAWMFNSIPKMIEGIKYFGFLLYKQFGIPGLLLMVIGIASMAFKQVKLMIFFSLIILTDIVYSANYNISDIESYYLMAFMGFAIFIFWGLTSIFIFIEKKTNLLNESNIAKAIVIIILSLFPFFNLARNYSRQDIHRWNLASAGVNNLLKSIQPNGIALIQYWDFNAPWLYLHYVEGLRTDAIYIQQDLLGCSWYLDFIQRKYPAIFDGSQKQVEEFKKALIPYEAGDKANIQAVMAKYNDFMYSIINQNLKKRPIYVDLASSKTYDFKLQKIPIGGLYKLEESLRYIPYDISNIDISSWESAGNSLDERALGALDCFYAIVKARVDYCNQLGHPEEAKEYLKLASKIETLFHSSRP